MAMRLPGFLSAHFLNEQLGASLNTRYPVDAKQLSLAQFYGQHFLFWMPWTLLLPGAIYVAVKARQAAARQPHLVTPAASDIIKLLGVWFALTLVSVAFSTRQDYYSMSCWGVMAGFLALPWLAGEISPLRMPRRFLVVPCSLIYMAGVFALGFVAWITPKLGSLGAITAAPIRERDTFMDAIAGISPALWGQFVALLGIFGGAMLFGGAFATTLVWQRRPFPALLVPLRCDGCSDFASRPPGFTMMSPYFSLAGEARAINREIATEPDAIVACDALPNTASSLYYYLNARVHWVNAPFNQDYSQRVLGLGHEYYWSDAEVLSEWRSSHPVYLIVEEERLAHWRGLLPAGTRVVNKSGTRVVLCNR